MVDDSRRWSRGLKRWLSAAPETRDELAKLVQESRRFLATDTVDMLEGVLELPATQVREIMTPRTQMKSLVSDDTLADILPTVLETAHSRYPVLDSHDGDAVIGILLTKDLIALLVNDLPLTLANLVRKPLYINETARCDTLLRLLQKAQVHMAVVLDEFGGVSGVVTMEDLLEEIVGDIVDEHDDWSADSDIHNIVKDPKVAGAYLVQAGTPIGDCNERLGSAFDDSDIDTMGGLFMQAVGMLGNLEGETAMVDGWQMTVVAAEGHHIEQLRLVAPEDTTDH